MKKRILIVLCFLCACTISGFAQINVKGNVSDGRGEPMIGVTVAVKGTSGGTVTDINGNYSVTVADIRAELQFSYLGYVPQTIVVGNNRVIDVKLIEASENLDEVIVIGYGTIRKSDLTGSISSVKVDETQAALSTSVDMMLQGKASGVFVNTGNSSPGGAISVRIRGTSSLNGNNEPLYVIDGVIIDNAMEDVGATMSGGKEGSNTVQEVQNGLTSLNPQDIESIEILKDASATAIYGSRGSNGVVLITTKKGASDKIRINVSSMFEVAKIDKKIPMLSGPEYVEYINGKSTTPVYTNTDDLTYVNWQDALTQTALTQTYRVSASRQMAKTNYYLAGGYTRNEGIVKTTGLEQYDFRSNFITDLTDRLSATVRYNVIYRKNNMTTGTDRIGGVSSSLIRQMTNYAPISNLSEDELAGNDNLRYTPMAWITDYDDKSVETRNTVSVALDYKLTDAFTIHVFGGYDNRYKQRSRWYGPGTYTGASANGQLGIANLRTEALNFEGLLYYNQTFAKKHRLSGTIGVTYDKKDTERFQMVNEDFSIKELGLYGMGTGNLNYPVNPSYSNYALASGLARLNYSYADKYLVTATARLDGSSKFTKDNRWSFFSSLAVAWRINQEAFLKDVEWISNLKLRAGWGETGNQAIDPFSTQSVYSSRYYSTATGTSSLGMASGALANTSLIWETTEQTNVGFDLGLFDGRLSFTFDAYYKKTRDMLQNMDAPLSSGYSTITLNMGSMLNKGLEFSVDGVILDQKELTWTLGGNISFNRNKILKLGLPESTFGMQTFSAYFGNNIATDADLQQPGNIFIEGKPIGLFWGYKTDGIWQDQSEAEQYTYGGTQRQGDVKFVDQNGDKEINEKDKVIIGDPNPDFVFGFNTSLRYRNLSLSATFHGTSGNDILNANILKQTTSHLSTNILKKAYDEAWTEERPGNTYPRIGYRMQGISDRLIEDGSYLRLGSLTLSYYLKLKKGPVRSAEVSVTGRNLLTWTSYSGFNPDVNSYTNDPSRIGIDWGGYPNSRSVSLGLNLAF